MNSSYERKSLGELKNQSRQQMQAAQEIVPCVTVTEKNWAAIIGLQQSQIQMLVEIQSAAARLGTKEELQAYLDSRMQELEGCIQAAQSATLDFQRELEQSAKATAKNLSSQAGKMSDSFSQNLSLEQDRMKEYSTRLFWISLIPSAALILLEVILRIWPLILPG